MVRNSVVWRTHTHTHTWRRFGEKSVESQHIEAMGPLDVSLNLHQATDSHIPQYGNIRLFLPKRKSQLKKNHIFTKTRSLASMTVSSTLLVQQDIADVPRGEFTRITVRYAEFSVKGVVIKKYVQIYF
jgi:hypothetical protein